MNVFHSLDGLPRFSRPVVTVGSFDGLHRGHRALLERVGRIAKEKAGESVVVTFSPHPRQVLPRGGDVRLLNTVPEKIFLLDEAGIDNLVIVPFDDKFAKTSYADFVGALVNKVGMESLVVGYDHRFGRDQEGGYSSLKDMSARLGFAVEQIPCQQAGEGKVSSTEVRNAIMAGDITLASELMTRSYIIIADIDGNGSVDVRDTIKLIPPPGHYKVRVGDGTDSCGDTLTITPGRAVRLEGWRGGEPKKNMIITF